MKILHCCLSNYYIDGFSYQENVLPKINVEHGHEVQILASTEILDNKGALIYLKPGEYQTKEGIRIIRLPYKKWFPHFVMKKIRTYKKTYEYIVEFAPDIIMFHGMAAFDMIQVAKYVKKHPETKMYADSHEDAHNSGTNFLSKNILHKIFYRAIIGKCMPSIQKVLYLTEETKAFNREMYNVPEGLLEYYPLGGELDSEEERGRLRKKIRDQYGITEDTLVIMHSGKLSPLKKTDLLLDGLKEVRSDKVVLFVAGSVPPESKTIIQKMQEDSRVKYLGWLNGKELREYLYACDIYAQPGTQSVTMQHAICCGRAVMLYPYISHKKLCHGNVFWIEKKEDIVQAINTVLQDPMVLDKMKDASWKIATEVLDYDMLAKRIER